MITPAFTKLQRSIVTSSIWLQDDETRLVWITLLALCDRDGIARVSPGILAHTARVSAAGCTAAIEILSSPDPDSRDNGAGQRIERVEGGFLILNYKRVLGEGTREERREYNRESQRKGRAKKKKLTIEQKADLPPANEHRPAGWEIAPPGEAHNGSFEQFQNVRLILTGSHGEEDAVTEGHG